MNKERKQQAVALLQQFKQEIIDKQCIASVLKNKIEEDILYQEWCLLDDIQELLIYGEDK